jgi:WD40 repeat protein
MRKLDIATCVHEDFVSAVMDIDYSPTGREFVAGSYGTICTTDQQAPFANACKGNPQRVWTRSCYHVACVMSAPYGPGSRGWGGGTAAAHGAGKNSRRVSHPSRYESGRGLAALKRVLLVRGLVKNSLVDLLFAAADRTVRIFGHQAGHSREVYHTKRMQRVFCVKYSGDAEYVLSGSDDMNVRIWKAHAAKQQGTLLPREKRKHAYKKALVDRYRHVPGTLSYPAETVPR